ncbi:Sorbitol dehydrogenase [Portunus trituberculatus]|uniref:Sorbitol dehydrogenase n=1 Tax=Portunus trituberculatus TaxID=210409 RepID=A0A5B7FI22_PORTR|nr:Sorbitol dehydrogenase [Portunus trituberculatus]
MWLVSFYVNKSFTVVDIAENRLQVAKSMGADHTVLVKGGDPEALAGEIKQLMGDMPDVTIECSGAESSIHLGIVVGIFGDN